MGKNIAQKPMAQFPCFRKFLNAIVEDISVVAHTFLIQRGDAEYIDTITDLLAHSVTLELQHQMRAISDIAAGGLGVLHFRRAVQPDRFQTSISGGRGICSNYVIAAGSVPQSRSSIGGLLSLAVTRKPELRMSGVCRAAAPAG